MSTIRPWLKLPNPHGFTTIGEDAKNIYFPPDPSKVTLGSKVQPRTSPVGKDRCGFGFAIGDVISVQTSDQTELVEVESIFLDDGAGKPYSARQHLFVHEPSGDVFEAIKLNYRAENYSLTPVDPTWISQGLGLVASNGRLFGDFRPVFIQGFEVRCKPLSFNSDRKIRIQQRRISVFGQDISRENVELALQSRSMPLKNDRQFFINVDGEIISKP